MKRIAAFWLAFCLLFGLASCGRTSVATEIPETAEGSTAAPPPPPTDPPETEPPFDPSLLFPPFVQPGLLKLSGPSRP